MKAPDNSINFEVVDPRDFEKIGSPEAHAANIGDPRRFEVETGERNHGPEIAIRREEILTALENIDGAPDHNKKAEMQAPSERAYEDLALRYPNIKGKTLGEARGNIKSANKYYQFGQMDSLALPTTAIGMGLVASQASLVPSFISALALGSTGTLTAGGILVASSAVLPLVAAAGYLAYSGYKMFKNWRTNKKVEKDIGILEKAYKAVQ